MGENTKELYEEFGWKFDPQGDPAFYYYLDLIISAVIVEERLNANSQS